MADVAAYYGGTGKGGPMKSLLAPGARRLHLRPGPSPRAIATSGKAEVENWQRACHGADGNAPTGP